MRKLLLAAALSSAFVLGGCATTGTASLIEQVRQYASTACAFLPTVETVAQILAGGNPTLQTVTALGDAICAAITRPAFVRPGVARVPTVDGVPIRGTHLR